MKIGPTGEYPRSVPLTDGDRGGCYASFQILKKKRRVVMNFGTNLSAVANTPSGALSLVKWFREEIRKAFGNLSYETDDLPIKVIPNVAKQFVESFFPMELEVLVANPEVFLAWADELEKAVEVVRAAN